MHPLLSGATETITENPTRALRCLEWAFSDTHIQVTMQFPIQLFVRFDTDVCVELRSCCLLLPRPTRQQANTVFDHFQANLKVIMDAWLCGLFILIKQ